MITVIKGSLLDSRAQVLVNPVNCVGVMGKGLALEFSKRWPRMFTDYTVRCSQKQLRLGEPYIWRGDGTWIMNFPTKRHWREASPISAVSDGLKWIVQHWPEEGIRSLAMPMLGCGNGGLPVMDVAQEIVRHLGRIPLQTYLYMSPGCTEDELGDIIDLVEESLED